MRSMEAIDATGRVRSHADGHPICRGIPIRLEGYFSAEHSELVCVSASAPRWELLGPDVLSPQFMRKRGVNKHLRKASPFFRPNFGTGVQPSAARPSARN
jgi:hypothetical protein